MDHDIRSRYILVPQSPDHAKVLKRVKDLEYRDFEDKSGLHHPPNFMAFPFSYRGGASIDNAFIQIISEGGEDYLMMNVGKKRATIFIEAEKLPEEASEIEIAEEEGIEELEFTR
jgi:hypothetical protein